MTEKQEILMVLNFRFEVTRDARRKIIELRHAEFSIKRALGGWGVNYNPNSSRPFAVKVSNDYLRNKANQIRTFKDFDSSVRAFINTQANL